MLSIDEAIVHAREVAKRNRILLDSDELIQKSLVSHFDKLKCEKCAEEHEQLAEWLEELKAIKDGSIPIIHGKAELELHDKVIRNEAIEDAKSVILQTIDNEILVDTLHLRLEQLKVRNDE